MITFIKLISILVILSAAVQLSASFSSVNMTLFHRVAVLFEIRFQVSESWNVLT